MMFDFVAQFVTVLSSSIAPSTKAIMVTTSGIGSLSMDDDVDDDSTGEVAEDQEAYQALGILSRPLGPEKIAGKEYRAEAVALRKAEGLVPVAWRDLRLERFFPNGIPKGRVSIVGYGGGFHTIDLTEIDSGDQKANIHTIYAPYEYANGVPQKAHSIIIQPDGDNGITLTHGDGYQVAITSNGILMRCPDANSFISLKEGEAVINATKIYAKGTLYVGQQGEAGLPLLAGIASPPCPSLFLSPV